MDRPIAKSATRYKAFLGVAPGLEEILRVEVEQLVPGQQIYVVPGGVELAVDREQLWTLSHYCRVAGSMRVRIGFFEARHFAELEQGLARVPWAAYLPRGSWPDVRVSCKKSRLYHSDAVRERVATYLGRYLRPGKQKEGAPPCSDVHVRLEHDKVTISVDGAGDRLHRRGYRTHVGPAPLRENLAAACIRSTGWMGERPIWDPFCGSGVILIEAISIACGVPTPVGRSFAFETWPGHDAAAYEDWLARRRPPSALAIEALGTDIAAESIEAARANAEAAALPVMPVFEEADFAQAVERVPRNALVIGNPPYGKRLPAGGDDGRLFERFGEMLAGRPDLQDVYLLTTGARIASETGLAWRKAQRFVNRGIKVDLLKLSRRPGLRP